MAQPSLLIVDDDATLTDQLVDLFRSEGYQVASALDGLDALYRLMAGVSPDLILLDMHMEGVNGWDFVAELEQLGLCFPILVLTGDDDPRRCAAQVGARGYLAKPFDLHRLLVMVERLASESPR